MNPEVVEKFLEVREALIEAEDYLFNNRDFCGLNKLDKIRNRVRLLRREVEKWSSR